MNVHAIKGRFARDPEFTRGDTPDKDRVKFAVAVDRRFGDETDFFDCTVFGKRASVVDKYLHKGSEIALFGEGQLRSYEDRNGVKRKAYSIVVNDFNFCGSKSEGGNSPAPAEDVPDGFQQVEEECPF